MNLTFEAILSLRVLANVNGFLFLRIFHITKFIVVSLPFKKEVANLLETIISSIVKC